MKKIRSWFWFLVQLLPFICLLLFMLARLGQGSVQYSTFTEFLTDFNALSAQWRFAPVYTSLVSVCNVIGSSTSLLGVISVINLISYEIFVLFMRICYEVIVFLPKFCISFFERKM